jgi:hypothetical protein
MRSTTTTAPQFLPVIAAARDEGRAICRGMNAVREREILHNANYRPKKVRAAYIHEEWARGRYSDPDTPVRYAEAPIAAPGTPRGVHFTPDLHYQSAGTLEAVTSGGAIAGSFTVYGDDADFAAAHAALTAILDRKDPA